jgi:hypothetical protein
MMLINGSLGISPSFVVGDVQNLSTGLGEFLAFMH